MKKLHKTFAQRAKAIEKKYSRAAFDDMERTEMLDEIARLREEQEEFREMNGLNDKEFDKEGGGPVMSPPPTAITPNIAPTLNPMGDLLPANQITAPEGTWRSPQTSILPTALSAGISMAGNALGLLNARKNIPQVDLPRITPRSIDLEPEREALRRSYNTASNVALRNSRDASAPGQAYANQVAGISGLTDSLGSGLSSSYLNEETTNANFGAQADQTNAQLGAQEEIMNAQFKDRGRAEASQYRDAIFQAPMQAMQDYRAQRAQDQMIGTMGKDYGAYEYIPAGEDRKARLQRLLFGPKYQIKNREYINTLNT